MLAVLAALSSLALYAQSTGSIEGHVTNSVTGEAVGGVKVRFLDRQSYVHESVTDSAGAYRISGLGDNDYKSEFTKDRFSTNKRALYFHVAGDVPVRVDAQLEPLGTLRGRVVDEDGNPAAGVRVEGPGREVTNENGEFAFQDLAPGAYTLVAKPKAKVRMQDGVRLGTVAVYYPSVTEPAQAMKIAVRTGADVAGIEIRMKSVPVHRVAGVVLNDAGKPATHAIVRLLDASGTARRRLSFGTWGFRRSPTNDYTVIGPGSEPELANVESRDDGAFEFAAVEQGDWRLSAEIGDDDEMPLGGVGSALVSDKDVENVQIRLAAPFAVEVGANWGSVQAPALGERAPNLLSLTPVEAQPALNLDPAKNIGAIFGLFPGRYRVIIPATVGLDTYVAAVMWGGRDVAGKVVDLTPGAAPFQVIYKPGLGKVRGTVEKGEGASVLLVPREAGEVSIIRTTSCGAGGAFEINEAVPGDYYVVAFDRSDIGGLPWDMLFSAILPIASGVRVESGATASANLRVSKWPW